jgi:anaerobic selenocysteine-containing dehydrogenase
MTVSELSTHRSYCRICIAACGVEIDVRDGRAAAVRGDAEHPLSGGYTCSKGRALPALHHDTDRLDDPLLRIDGGLVPVTWERMLADLDACIAEVIGTHGAQSIGIFAGSGIYQDAAGYWAMRRLARRMSSGHAYSDLTIDAAPKYRALELVAGTYALAPHADPAAELLLLFGTNPVVSHGQTAVFDNPVQRLRRSAQRGQVWVIDPRRTESARLASRHLAAKPGTDHAILALLIRAALASGSTGEAGGRRVRHVEALAAAVAPYDLTTAARITGLPEEDLADLLDVVRRAGRLAVATGTGVTMSPGGNVCEWLALALLAVTDSLDRPGGVWFNPGYVARLDERGSLPAVPPATTGPPTRPDIAPTLGEWPAAVIPHEIDAGNLKALFVLGANAVTALPDTNRLLAALPKLDVFGVVDVVRTPTTELATHVLPSHAQLERADVPMLNDLFFGARLMQYTAPVLPTHPNRRSGWWIIERIARSMGVDILPAHLDGDTATDEAILDAVAGEAVMDALRHADTHWLVDDSPVFGWVDERLPNGSWDLAPERLVGLLPALDAPAPLVVTPRRQPKRFNGVDVRGGDRPDVLLHPDDAAGAGVADGDLVEVTSAAGTLVTRAVVSEATSRGAASLAHGWPEVNVNLLVSSTLLDPTTGMPHQSGTAVSVRRVP